MPPVPRPAVVFNSVGAELQEAGFGEIIGSVAKGIAEGQRALDLDSIQTMVVLAKTMIPVIPEISEVITGQPITVPISGAAPIQVTGARVTTTASDPVEMSALQCGLLPSFYQFTEAVIDLNISIQLRIATQTNTDGSQSTGLFAFASHVNFRTQNTYSYQVSASSSVIATLKPVPPNVRLTPSIVTVNALNPNAPIVSTGS
jgi:hypothetical protein